MILQGAVRSEESCMRGMITNMSEVQIVNIREIQERMTRIYVKAGIPQEDAEVIVDTLVEAELEGRESHGLMRFAPLYRRILSGGITKTPNISTERIGTNLYTVDGDNAAGAVLAARVMKFCEEVAKENGTAIAAVKNANHLGAAGYYTSRAAKNGFFAFLATNAGPGVAPTGGMSKLLGTSPFSVSFPAGKYDHFTLDIATSASAYGKIMMYAKEEKEIPLGWAMDENGYDTTNAQAAVDAFNKGVGILPMAAHKGMGISMIIDVLAGLLSGAKFSCEVSNAFTMSKSSGVGFFYIVMDIERFMSLNAFTSRVEKWFDLMKNDKCRPGSTGIFVPGELENARLNHAGDTMKVFSGTIDEIEKIESEMTL